MLKKAEQFAWKLPFTEKSGAEETCPVALHSDIGFSPSLRPIFNILQIKAHSNML